MVNNISIGNAGEYFVAAELERHGFSVAIPMSNTELFDILALKRDNHNQYAIQVKTNHSNKKEWILNKKNETVSSENIYYIFVCMNDLNNPEYHIVPSLDVSKMIKDFHQTWLKTPGKNNKSHNDNTMRKFLDNNNDYLNKWDLLK